MGTVTDLEEWRRTHGPAVRCIVAMQRAWWKWAALPWEVMGRWLR